MSLMDLFRLVLINPIISLFSFHKKKMLFFIVAFGVWAVFLFPKSDAKNFIEQIIAKQTKGKVSLEMESLSFSLVPFGVKTTNTVVRVAGNRTLKNGLKSDAIVVSPNLASLLAFKPGASLSFINLFGGSGSISGSMRGKTKEKAQKFAISGNFVEAKIQEIVKLLDLSVPLPGTLEASFNLTGEDSFRQQPEADFKVRVSNLKLPNPLETPMGPFDFPKQVIWKNSNIFGKMERGEIKIKEGTLGTKDSEVNGRFKGSVRAEMRRIGRNIKPNLGSYNLTVELELSKAFERELGTILSSTLGNAKKSLPGGGAKYIFRVSGNAAYRGTPRFSPLTSYGGEDI